jgi:uncharacterized protein (TIGR02117 family)
MKALKKIGIILLKTIAGIVALVVVYMAIAIITGLIPVNSGFKNQKNGTEIWVSSNGVHTDIIVPTNSSVINWKTFLKLKKECNFLAFGWGDKEFYMNTPTWADLKLGTALKALFWPTDAVLQVYCLSTVPYTSKNTIKITLDDKQANDLNSYIYDTFNLSNDGSPIVLIPDKGPDSEYKYYKANGKYSMFFTCNNWTSRGLKHAGIKNALWAPFDKSVLYHLK